MISYKVKGIILAVIISLASIMMPFSVYADTFEWYRVTGELMSSQLNNELTINNTKVYEYLFNYQYHVKFDDSYLGYAQISVTQEYYDDTDNNGNLSVDTLKTYTTPVKTYYVNSDEVVVNLSLKVRISAGHIQTNYDPCKNFTPSVSVSNANVKKIGLLTSIDEVIDILSNIYNSVDDIEGLSNNQLSELENIVSNTSLANQYLDTLSQLKQFNVPIESLSYCYTLLYKYSDKVVNVKDYYYFQYPLFYLIRDDEAVRLYLNNSSSDSFDLIFATSRNINNTSKFMSEYIGSRNYTINSFESLGISDSSIYLRLIKVNISSSTSTSDIFTLNIYYDQYFVPILIKREDQKINYSTDFALVYGLSNQLLDDLHIIAQGTTQSNSAASDLESEASEYSDIADDVIGVEEGLTSNFETSVNQIDLNTGLNGFGGNFMTSATWVRTQFDRLTENTPYGSLVVYGLTLGFVLLMLGKVLL